MTKFLTAIGIYSKAKYEQMIKKISKHYNTTTTKYCHCQIGKGDNCGPFNYYTDCSPPLKNKKGKRRGIVIVFLLKSYTW
jgi:hypothetical protein